MHRQELRTGMHAFDSDFDQLAVSYVFLDHTDRHLAPSEPGF
jgi:hypothetical protein